MAISIKNANIQARGRIRAIDILRPSNISFVGHSTSLTQTCSWPFEPNQPQVGDLGIFFDYIRGSQNGGAAPSGWELFSENNIDFQLRYWLYYKKLTDADINANVSGHTGNQGQRKMLVVYRPDRNFTSVNILNLTSSTSATTLNSVGSAPTIAFGTWGANNDIPSGNRSSSISMNELPGGSSTYFLKYKVYNPGNTLDTINFSTAALNCILASFYLQIN
jgi:hypothetical protein